MKLHDLQLLEILDLRPDQGLIRLRDQRMVVQSTAALGVLRRQLIRLAGPERARQVLLRYGYAQGYHDALSMAEHMAQRDPVERALIGCTIHTLQGMVQVCPVAIHYDRATDRFEMEAHWRNSYEAEQQLHLSGAADGGVCWATLGYASGFSAGTMNREVFFTELACTASGAEQCHVVGKDVPSWGEAEAARLQAQYGEGESLEELRDEIRRGRKAAARTSGCPGEDSEPEEAGIFAQATALAESHRFVVRSKAMAEVVDLAARVAPLDTTVVILGESGTGKEFLARFVHEQSSRAGEPLVTVNCAALTESLLESEIFGHVKGAFTGAVRDKAGLFEAAGGGTLFLDEVGEMPLSVQAKLLRALEQGEIRRVGDVKSVKVRARVVAATNRDLKARVEEGAFREDLYYRLCAFVLRVPPLRERREEIAPLVHYFLHLAAARLEKAIHSLSPEVMTRLINYGWPGNVRELQHAVERATIVASGSVIGLRDLPEDLLEDSAAPREADKPQPRLPQPGPAQTGEDAALNVQDQERALIEAALRRFGGQRNKSAAALGISPVTLWRRMKRYGLS